MKLQDKIVLITGGNSGIGLATAKLFHAEGATVIITGRRKNVVENAVKEIGQNATGFASDTSIIADIEKLYTQIKEQFGRLDVLYLNAGIAKFEPLEIVTEERFDELSNTNFKGLFFNVQYASPLMPHGSSILITTSAASMIGSPNMSVYGTTKAAARSLARTLSGDLLPKGIRVNGISPGPIDTPIMEKVGIPLENLEEAKAGFSAQNPMKRIGKAEEIAKAALFLASNDSSFIAGVDLAVDGGLTQL
jgi:NAD(P)-dependent dehydrogenase (short-subunit alcohol dehydrogenase family)